MHRSQYLYFADTHTTVAKTTKTLEGQAAASGEAASTSQILRCCCCGPEDPWLAPKDLLGCETQLQFRWLRRIHTHIWAATPTHIRHTYTQMELFATNGADKLFCVSHRYIGAEAHKRYYTQKHTTHTLIPKWRVTNFSFDFSIFFTSLLNLWLFSVWDIIFIFEHIITFTKTHTFSWPENFQSWCLCCPKNYV